MNRARQVAAFWDWLPTFRVVAELEHLGQAASRLGISSSAVSRTVSLLERELQVELFSRQGRGLRLTDAGHILQAAVRDAMRTVHDASLRFEQSALHGPLRVSSVSPASEEHLLPVLEGFLRRFPGVRVTLTETSLREVSGALLRGELDVALVRTELKPKGLSVRRLSSSPMRIYAPPSLCLKERRRYSFESLARVPFVGMTDRHGEDPFPLSVEREVVFWADTFDQAQSAAGALGALVVLPQLLGRRAVRSAGFRLLSTPTIRPATLCACWRTPLAFETAADRLVEVLSDPPVEG